MKMNVSKRMNQHLKKYGLKYCASIQTYLA